MKRRRVVVSAWLSARVARELRQLARRKRNSVSRELGEAARDHVRRHGKLQSV